MVDVLLCQTDDCRRRLQVPGVDAGGRSVLGSSGEERRVGLAWWGRCRGLAHGLFMYATSPRPTRHALPLSTISTVAAMRHSGKTARFSGIRPLRCDGEDSTGSSCTCCASDGIGGQDLRCGESVNYQVQADDPNSVCTNLVRQVS